MPLTYHMSIPVYTALSSLGDKGASGPEADVGQGAFAIRRLQTFRSLGGSPQSGHSVGAANVRFRPFADISRACKAWCMTDAPLKVANGKCPACGMPVPFARANFRRGQPFACKACRELLRTNKVSIGLAVAAFALASYLGKEFGFLAVLGVLTLLVIYEWLTVRVAIVGEAKVATEA